VEDDFRQALSLGDGQVLSGKYHVGARLGLGEMGSVFAAHDLLLDVPVIIRCLRPSLLADPDAVAAFEQEARGSIDRGTLVTGVPYIVQESLSTDAESFEVAVGQPRPAPHQGRRRSTFALVAVLLFLVAGAMSLAFGGRRSAVRSRAMIQAASEPPVRHPIEIAAFVVPNSATEDPRRAVLPPFSAASSQARGASAEPPSRDRGPDEDGGSSNSSAVRRQFVANQRQVAPAKVAKAAKAPTMTQSAGATLVKADDCHPSFDFDEQGRRHFTACAATRSRLGVAPRPTPACSPSFELDDQGRKHFKPECFLDAQADERPMASRSWAR
jgi:hypothetical protein